MAYCFRIQRIIEEYIFLCYDTNVRHQTTNTYKKACLEIKSCYLNEGREALWPSCAFTTLTGIKEWIEMCRY